ncbi:MAG: DUF4886 domain-containing protein [Bacteroidales bacterium]|nr:DUF4886 domain-containing protein [Bacteroidales bacterium]
MKKQVLLTLALCATMLAWGETVTKTVDQLATMHGWANATAYQSFTMNDVISVAAKTSSDKICVYPNGYYTSSKWYMYQGDSNGEFTISAALGYIIKTIKITYSPQNSGILSFKSGFGIAEADQIASGSSVTVDKQSATLYVGCTAASSSSTNINARITQFTVTYELVEQSLIEEFRDPVGDTLWNHNTAATTKLGTYGEWEMEGIRHTNPSNDMDKLKTNNTPGVGIGWAANPHMQTTAEGGVKALSFLWNQGATAKETDKTEKITVTVGDKTQDDTFTGTTTASRPADRTFMFSPEVKSNATLRLEGVNGNRIVVGPITIIPYIRYTQKAQTANAADKTYDATTGLINNTLGGVVTYSIVTEGAQATIDATTGVVDMSKVTTAEDITVKATYEDAYTTMSLHINTLPVPTVSFADGDAVEKDMNVIGYVNTLTKDGDGAITYTSSDETVATVNAEGVITIIGEGATTITAKIAACKTYAAAEASYALTITDPKEDAYVETFERNSGGASAADRVGAYYTWTITTGVRTKESDILFNKTPSIWLAGNGGASMETTIEGGIKRVGFLWNKFNKTATPVSVSVIAGGVERTLTKEVQTGEAYNQNDPDLVFNSNFGIKSNTKLKIANPQSTTALQIGPISITPYIFYTAKDTTIDMTKAATFTNDQLIDNRDDATAIVYSIVGDNDGVASIDASTGEVTCQKTGTVTVQAAYGEAKTTYTLTINSKGNVDAKFATEGKVEKVLADGSFTNAVVITAGDATPAYTSDNTSVAEVDADGKVTIKGIGTAVITATMEETQKYLAWQDSYTLIVRTGIATDKKLVEHFTQMPKGLISTAGGEAVKGDIDITWQTYYARRGDNDTIGGTGVQGNNIFATGFIDSKTTLEGGIKYFSFNWKQWASEKGATLKLVATINDTEYPMEYVVTDPSGATTLEHFFFAQNVSAKKNTAIKLENKSYTTESGTPLTANGRITFDAFEIVPYLYYTQKYATLDLTQATTFTNDQLIDNRDDATAIVYSIVGANDGVATIDAATGEVTGLKAGNVTVQAAWGDVTTTYSLRVLEKWVPSDTVRILGIGNSFTMDALQQHMMPIVIGQGKKAIVGYPYRGGTWQSEHATFYETNAKKYNYYKFDPEGNMSSTGSNSATLRGAIEDEPWDYVYIQSDHDSAGIVKSYIPHIKTLIADIKASCSNPYVKIGMYMTWAYDSTSTYKAFDLYGKDTQVMYDSIVNATKAIMKYTGIDTIMVIPAGTAIQNARTSYVGHTLNRDGYHLDYNYGRYIASLCWYNRIFGTEPKDIIYQPTTLDDYCSNMCRAAAQAAIEHPFNVTELTDYKEPLVPVVSDDDSTLVTLRVNGMNIPLVEGQKEYTCPVDQDMSTMQLWVLPTSTKASPFLYQGKADIPDTDIRGYYEVAAPEAGTSTEIRIKVVAEDKIHEGNYTLILNTAEAKDITYTIASRADLEEFAAAVNRGSNTISAIQTADIDMNHTKSLSWKTPIGSETTPFKGTYNGQDYKISGFCIYSEEDPVLGQMTFVGLFGLIDHATLRNIRLSGTEECHYNREGTPAPVTLGCGILCGGMMGSLIEDCSVNMNLFTNTETGAVGLICGRDNSSEDVNIINRCYASGTWRIRRNGIYGGILGYGFNTRITNCYSLCTMGLQRDFAARMGGIVGYAKSSSTDRAITVKNCYNYGAIKDDRAAQGQATTAACALGAIAGNADGTKVQLINCYYLETSCTNAYGSGTPAAAEVTSATDTQMKDGTVATKLGSEFEQGASYPVLIKKSPTPTEMDVIRPWEESGKTKKYWSNRQIILVTPFGTYNAVGQRLQ